MSDFVYLTEAKYPDKVNHPDHYKAETGMEVIDVIEAFTFDLKGIEATDTGNILKYICRWKKKNGLEDLKKAEWYLKHLIDHVEKLEKENSELEHPYNGFAFGLNPTNNAYDLNITLDDMRDAQELIEEIKIIHRDNGCVTVEDIFDLLGDDSTYIDSQYVLNSLDDIEITRPNGTSTVIVTFKNIKEKENNNG